ncbi:MAG: ribonuclease R [Ruminococcaceae bacterium]|nr:ribonuclease R [Oscillospiraceae bacterium]
MELKEIIKEYLNEEDLSYKPYELYTAICGDATDQYDAFYKALGALEKEGEIVYTKKGKIMAIRFSGVVRGTFRASAKGFGFVTPDGQDVKKCDIFIPRDNTFDAIEGDTVLVSLSKPKNRTSVGQSDEGKVIKIVSHSLKTLVGTLLVAKGRNHRKPLFYIVPDNKRHNLDITVERSDLNGADVGDKVEIEITKYPTGRNAGKGKVITVFGESDSLLANYNAVLHSHNIKTLFPKNVLDDADSLSRSDITPDGRLDLRDRLIFTIDGIDAKDLDDAISAEKTDNGYILGVHIADVSHYVTENTPLDEEAFTRGTSVYFADKVVPMLPKALSNGICSLNKGVDRYTLSAFVTLDKKGEIIDVDIKESIINSKIRGVYSELNDVIEYGDGSEYYEKYSPVLGKTLDTMLELYDILAKKSAKRGALDIETSEAKIIVNEFNEPTDIIKIERGVSEMLIEQFMLCANEGVANWLSWRDMPGVYRIHENPDPEKIRTFDLFAHNLGINTSPLHTKTLHPTALRRVLGEAKEKQLDSILSKILLRCLMKAKYSSNCSPHFGLAIDKYCHFTSPIRRYPDLATHRIIKKVLKNEITEKNIGKYTAFATQAAIASSENEVKAQMAERDIEDLYKTVYMLDYIGETFRGVITSVTSFGFFVELPNTCEGLVPISSLDGYYDFDERSFTLSNGRDIFSLGMEVEVIIEDVDIITRKTDMRVIMQ